MSTSNRNAVTPGYRVDIALRSTVAIAGGYFLALAAGRLAALALPLTPVDAVLAAAMLAFAVYAWLALWAFRCRSATKLCIVTAVLYGLCLALARVAEGILQ
ncbi:hypothetical protein PIGHUM_00183 [Pigmentiphaga humi]|uniref:Iron uptake protein n=1 Tax=Pigmentiphaga humi TaxID=2478468 RepID=A0A3P4AVV2_9BURK|nr:iron transporter [Pigmentiphaga humi]VCU68133.1 hypothetical protein PIGHUM_00183 [Pigmentiphaga humi]